MAAEELVHIEVAGLDGRIHELRADPASTVADVKRQLSHRTGKTPECLNLVCGTVALADDETIGDLGLPTRGALLTLLVRREQLALSGDQDGELRLWSVDSGSCLRTFAPPDCHGSVAARAVCVSWEEMLALCGYSDGHLQLWDLNTAGCLRSFDGHSGPVRGVGASWAGRVAVSGSADGLMMLWDLDTGTCQETIACGNPVLALATDWASSRTMSAHANGMLRLWDVRAGGHGIRVFRGHTRHVLALAVDWSAGRALSGSLDCRMRLWDLDCAECLRSFVVKQMPHRGDAVNAVAMDWPRQRGVSGSGDSCLQLWDLATGDSLGKLCNLGGTLSVPVCALALLHAGGPESEAYTVLTGSSDGRVRLLHLGRSLCLKTFTGHAGPVSVVVAAGHA